MSCATSGMRSGDFSRLGVECGSREADKEGRVPGPRRGGALPAGQELQLPDGLTGEERVDEYLPGPVSTHDVHRALRDEEHRVARVSKTEERLPGGEPHLFESAFEPPGAIRTRAAEEACAITVDRVRPRGRLQREPAEVAQQEAP